jgi:hypothetical protein
MRNILLATAVIALGSSSAMAAGSVNFNLKSSLGKVCTIATAASDLTVGPLAATTAAGAFDTTCNFELSDLTLTFTSANGGLYNTVEAVKVPYTVTFDGETVASADAVAGVSLVRASGAVANTPIHRDFSVALASDITVAGDYADVLTVDVAP